MTVNTDGASTDGSRHLPNNEPGPLTDSPWFWLGLFSLAAVVALLAIGPKFQQRQQRLERQSQVREQVWRDRLEQPSGPEPIERPYPAGSGLPLWPLAALALVAASGCWGWLWWQRGGARNAQRRRTSLCDGQASAINQSD